MDNHIIWRHGAGIFSNIKAEELREQLIWMWSYAWVHPLMFILLALIWGMMTYFIFTFIKRSVYRFTAGQMMGRFAPNLAGFTVLLLLFAMGAYRVVGIWVLVAVKVMLGFFFFVL